MPVMLHERTVLPPKEHDELARLAGAFVAGPSQGPYLVGSDGVRLELPESVFRVLRDIVEALNQGLAITVAPHNTMLTTQETADLLGISRPTLVKLLAEGEIPFTMRGRHRRVLLADAVDYQQRSRAQQLETLRRMAQEGQKAGLYDLTIDPIHPH